MDFLKIAAIPLRPLLRHSFKHLVVWQEFYRFLLRVPPCLRVSVVQFSTSIPLLTPFLCIANNQIRPRPRRIVGSLLRFTQSSDSRKFALFASFAAYLSSSALS